MHLHSMPLALLSSQNNRTTNTRFISGTPNFGPRTGKLHLVELKRRCNTATRWRDSSRLLLRIIPRSGSLRDPYAHTSRPGCPDRALQLPQVRAGIDWAGHDHGIDAGAYTAFTTGRAGDYSYPRDLRSIQFCMPGRLRIRYDVQKQSAGFIHR
jgi:hypothetical protein